MFGPRLLIWLVPLALLGAFAISSRPRLLLCAWVLLPAAFYSFYSVDGVNRPASASNVITDAILGVEMTLKGTTTTPISITVSDPAPDTDSVKAKLTAFITAYNCAVDHIRGKIGEKRI